MKKLLFTFLFLLGLQTVFAQADPVLIEGNPPITQKTVDAYTNYQEWHFELRFTPEQRQKYQSFLLEDLKKGRLLEDVKQSPQIVDGFKKSDWMTIFTFHSQQKQKDSVELSTEQILNNGQIHGDGLRAQTRKEAKKGYLSSAYLLKTSAEYDNPLVGDGNIHTSLFRRQVDAVFEWTAFRITMVAGKRVVDATEKDRAEMAQRIIKTWNDNKNNSNKLNNFKSWLDGNVADWLIWRAAEYSFFLRQTPYQRKSQLAEWGQQISGLAPAMKPYIEQRIKEYKDYVAKMPDAEVKTEFQLKQKTDAKFAAEMQKMQAQMKMNQQTFAQMRQSMLDLHVANLNIAENTGNTGYVWTIK